MQFFFFANRWNPRLFVFFQLNVIVWNFPIFICLEALERAVETFCTVLILFYVGAAACLCTWTIDTRVTVLTETPTHVSTLLVSLTCVHRRSTLVIITIISLAIYERSASQARITISIAWSVGPFHLFLTRYRFLTRYLLLNSIILFLYQLFTQGIFCVTSCLQTRSHLSLFNQFISNYEYTSYK